jgi:fluoroquinolone transport system permease protein
MSAVLKLFHVGLRQVLRDGMLLLLLPAPFLMGAAFRILLPFADGILIREIGFTLVPWYPLSDAFILSMAPLMTALVCAFVILDERDEGTGMYFNITPAGGRAYLMARMGLPMVWAYGSAVVALVLFGLTIDLSVILTASVIGVLQGIISCMLLVTIAGNKVEGLALSKIANLLLLGLPVPWFIEAPYKYLFGFLPSFWIGEMIMTTNGDGIAIFHVMMGIVTSLIWIALLFRLFLRRTY